MKRKKKGFLSFRESERSISRDASLVSSPWKVQLQLNRTDSPPAVVSAGWFNRNKLLGVREQRSNELVSSQMTEYLWINLSTRDVFSPPATSNHVIIATFASPSLSGFYKHRIVLHKRKLID